MSNEDPMNPAERELETALGSLRPAPPAFDFERVRTRALIERARRGTRVWQTIAAAIALAAGTAFALRPAPNEVERIVYRDRPVAERATPEVSTTPMTYLTMRSEVLANGPSALQANGRGGASEAADIRVRPQRGDPGFEF